MGTALRHMRSELVARHETEDPRLAGLKSAHFVGDTLVLSIVRDFISKNAKAPRIFLTGVPRNIPQVKTVLPILKHTGFARHTIWFDTPAQTCYDRPMRPDRGEDDNMEARLTRMTDYRQLTMPIRDLLKTKTDFAVVDQHGGTIEEVRAEIERLSFMRSLNLEPA